MLAPAFVVALPWLLWTVAVLWRMRGSPTLDALSPAPPPDAPLVSVIIPARDEARNIARCLNSIRETGWPAVEILVVDDRSADDTARIAREVAAHDPRVRVLDGEPLPEGWFGKQWACAQGARAARGAFLLFTDADTVHAPDLLPRAMRAARDRALDLCTVAGRQELGTFWERVVMPQVFQMLLARYGGPGEVNRSPRASDKIANGQFMLFSRDAYDAIGGHGAVRTKAAEDLALAQLVFRRGRRGEVVLGIPHLATRMYESLGEVVRGWSKNIFAASADAMPFGRLGRALLPLVLLIYPIFMLAPPATLLASLVIPLSATVVTWAIICTAVSLVWWMLSYATAARLSPLWALAYPLGAAVLLGIIVRAIARGRRVEWKGREYVAG